MRRALLLIAPLLALCGAHGIVAAETRVPFTSVGNLIIIEVRMNGARPLSCVLDTGAARMVVDTQVSRELQLPEAESDTIGGAGAGRVPVRKIHGVTLEIAGLKSTDYEFVAADLAGVSSLLGRRVEGVVGYQFLSRFIVTIDYAKRELLLHDPKSADRIEGEELPLRIEKGWAFIRGTLRLAGMDSVTDEFLLDSGSDDALDHPLAAEAADRASTRTGNGLGSPVDGFIATAASLKLGTQELRDLPMSSGGGTPQTSRLIGGGVLSRFRVTLDYPHARIFLAPRD